MKYFNFNGLKIVLYSIPLAVLGGVKQYERFFKVKIGNKTLDEVRRKYKVNGMNSIAEVMPLIGSYSG